MNIEREQLIELCNKFLNNEISKSDLNSYSFETFMSDEIDWDDYDNIISETLFDWHNEDINFPINEVNMKLWKKRLETNVDELLEHNYWNIHIEKQKAICEKYKSKWKPISRNLKIGISENLNLEKLNGLRLKTEKGKICWYVWSGEYSEDENFFKPICAEHFLQRKPKIIQYLGLDDGFRFLITENGYEDIWYDKNLLET